MTCAFHCLIADFSVSTAFEKLGKLISSPNVARFATHRTQQTRAWQEELRIIEGTCRELIAAHPASSEWMLILEFEVPRRAKRIDAVLLASDVVLTIEFKVGETRFKREDIRQAEDYALELSDFHEQSHNRTIVPVLVATRVSVANQGWTAAIADKVQPVVCANADMLARWILEAVDTISDPTASTISAQAWLQSRYEPTPNIVEAAQDLYLRHNVREISHSRADAKNLSATQDAVERAVEVARNTSGKVICFITGVPGAGKTLAGLNLVNRLSNSTGSDCRAVFLSGNGPLVNVLREALAREETMRSAIPIGESRRRSSTFIYNVHRWLDEYIDKSPTIAPIENLVIFDEAQRAWNREQSLRKFQRDDSEPSMILKVMSRKTDWGVLVALVGGGQEINTGEAGLREWGRALQVEFRDWQIVISPELLHGDSSTAGTTLFSEAPETFEGQIMTDPDLHLSVPTRTYRADGVAAWVNAVLDGRTEDARAYFQEMDSFPIAMTRSLDTARGWLRERTRGLRRCGLVASSGARRLRVFGLDVAGKFEETHWFLGAENDVRSSYYLEVPASEYKIQGLELDWIGLCWGADLRRDKRDWNYRRFSGTRWQVVRDKLQEQYLLNKYRVLMTRAREGMIIWVPHGDRDDPTRKPSFYEGTAAYLATCGIPLVE